MTRFLFLELLQLLGINDLDCLFLHTHTLSFLLELLQLQLLEIRTVDSTGDWLILKWTRFRILLQLQLLLV